jgi:hypothetical protein
VGGKAILGLSMYRIRVLTEIVYIYIYIRCRSYSFFIVKIASALMDVDTLSNNVKFSVDFLSLFSL